VLTTDQMVALHLYSQPTQLYRELNKALRNKHFAAVEPFLPFLKLFVSALDALHNAKKKPQVQRALYRGVPLDLKKEYRVGQEIVWRGVSSCTTDLDVAMSFAGTLDGESAKKPATLFHILAVGVDIGVYSAVEGEEEVIVHPGTILRVTEVLPGKKGITTIKLVDSGKARLVQ
jgi:hypothetical protein